MQGKWETTDGGGGDILVALVAVVAACVVLGAAAAATARAVASIPAYVWVVAPVLMVAGVAVFTRFMVRHSRAQAAAFAARCEQMAAAEALEDEARHRRAVERRAASAPVIHNWIVTDPAAAITASRTYTPATVITEAQEITR